MLFMTAGMSAPAQAPALVREFRQPPASARPWVYWFWLDGNITKEGITADLEAMKRAGIGGVLIMEVSQGTPTGPVPFASPAWRAMFKHVVREANRLGLQVNMNDDAGWCGSGGPWITPELSMQKLVWTEKEVAGPTTLEEKLPQPETVAGFYRDVEYVAFPSPSAYRIPDIRKRAGFERRDYGAEIDTEAPADAAVDPAKIVRIKPNADGSLRWNVPAGKWTILRMGHASTGRVNLPSPRSGEGLECDKLSKAGTEAAFNGFIGKLIQDVGPLAGKTFVRTHIDSWEMGSQNWTSELPAEFKRLRGYDIDAYLPVLTGRVVGSREISERFLWDFRQTLSEMMLENYAGYMQALAKKHGIELSCEAYGSASDSQDFVSNNMAYAGRVAEPMTEFWTGGSNLTDPTSVASAFLGGVTAQMVSAAHVYGKPIVGAESFTSDTLDRWRFHPGLLKGLGDFQLASGVNRFVFHRYAMQPWNNGIRPGMSMGPWGLHYERTETWWDESKTWHQYLARCQSVLRKGTPVVDLLYLAPEGAPSNFSPPPRDLKNGYAADACPTEALLKLAFFRDGYIEFPSGVRYRALVLPKESRMTPETLRVVCELAAAGATVVGPKPVASPSLSGYPACDATVQRLARETWGRGEIVDRPVEKVLAAKKFGPDMISDRPLAMNHRKIGDTDVYFVSNPKAIQVDAICRFRTLGKAELWNAETGEITPVSTVRQIGGTTEIPLAFGPSDSVFVVFRPGRSEPVAMLTRNGKSVFPAATPNPKIEVLAARWGPMLNPEGRTRDVTDQVRRILRSGKTTFSVASLQSEGDPAYGVVKTLIVDYTVNGVRKQLQREDTDNAEFLDPNDPIPAGKLIRGVDGSLKIRAREAGAYRMGTLSAMVAAIPRPIEVKGEWSLSLPKLPTRTVTSLKSWSTEAASDLHYFSGTGTYRKTIRLSASAVGDGKRQILDLGQVGVMARVRINGKDLGLLWRAPYKVDATAALKAGDNSVEIEVTNLWINRMIGDEQLPNDTDRNPDGSTRTWPSWLNQGLPSPTGRQTFSSWTLWRKTDPLQPSGLMGPVVIRTEVDVSLKR